MSKKKPQTPEMMDYREANAARLYRQVPRKARLVGGDESAQLKNNKI